MLAIAVTACGSSTKTTSQPGGSGAATNMIVIKNFAFKPASATVQPGAMVTVHNVDSTTHTLTATGSAKGDVRHWRHRRGPDQDVHGPDEAGQLPVPVQHPQLHDRYPQGELSPRRLMTWAARASRAAAHPSR